MGVLLALSAAVAYGFSDFLGGLQSRRISSYAVAVLAQCAALVGVFTAAALAPVHGLSAAALAWGALSGIGSGAGTLFLYRGLGSGRMSVVAPLSAVGSAGLPVVVGVVFGERPSWLAAAGIVLALPAVALISRGEEKLGPEPARRSGVWDGLLAGAGFALLFIALGRVPAGAGLWPLAAGQVVSTGSLALAALVTGTSLRSPRRAVAGSVAAGLLGATATLLYQYAAQRQLLAVAAVLTSLYPALTVLAAMVLLREHIGRGQAVGLVAAAAAVTLITLG